MHKPKNRTLTQSVELFPRVIADNLPKLAPASTGFLRPGFYVQPAWVTGQRPAAEAGRIPDQQLKCTTFRDGLPVVIEAPPLAFTNTSIDRVSSF